jgi:uncharacterized cofD-like protein
MMNADVPGRARTGGGPGREQDAGGGRPSVVAIGGGHGLACTLRAVRRYAGRITAVVSVADDGGSSGRLREQLGIPAPGDVRKCLAALAPEGSLLGAALGHRFSGFQLEGHAFGNLLIAALTAETGDFLAAIAEAGRLLGAVGEVLPATAVPVDLKAEAESGVLEGQVRINATRGLRRISLVPLDAEVPRRALAAIAAADQIVIGPGSLYTSVLAACAPPALREAIAAAPGQRVFVCNIRQQAAETSGFDAAAHLDALAGHGVVCDVMLVDPVTMPLGRLGEATRAEPGTPHVVPRSLAGADGFEHEPALLGEALYDCLIERARSAPLGQSRLQEGPDVGVERRRGGDEGDEDPPREADA